MGGYGQEKGEKMQFYYNPIFLKKKELGGVEGDETNPEYIGTKTSIFSKRKLKLF